MAKLYELTTLESIAAERIALEKRALKQESNLQKEVNDIKKCWKGVFSISNAVGSVVKAIAPRLDLIVLGTTLLGKLFRRKRK
ncbi:MAG: hypothetical protein IJ834_00510 [Paludibacteraceae bacterium]|nr:hypothetical protein [Paludibacteraceae bacterium]